MKTEIKKERYQLSKLSSGWQICPKCYGQGVVWFPTGIPFNETFSGDGKPFICDVCKGEKIISVETGLPPKKIK
jgi:hypothetical protein